MENEDEASILRKELKCWESMFARKYGRKPVKEDINQSSAEIKESYKRYAYLKSEKAKETPIKVQKEETLKNDQVEDGVFSSSLNKKIVKSPPEKIVHLKKDSNSWRPKLKPIKRNEIPADEKAPISAAAAVVEDISPSDDVNISISSPIISDLASPLSRNGTGSGLKKKPIKSSRFRNVSQDALNTCKDYLDRFQDTPIKNDQNLADSSSTALNLSNRNVLKDINQEKETIKSTSEKSSIRNDLDRHEGSDICHGSDYNNDNQKAMIPVQSLKENDIDSTYDKSTQNIIPKKTFPTSFMGKEDEDLPLSKVKSQIDTKTDAMDEESNVKPVMRKGNIRTNQDNEKRQTVSGRGVLVQDEKEDPNYEEADEAPPKGKRKRATKKTKTKKQNEEDEAPDEEKDEEIEVEDEKPRKKMKKNEVDPEKTKKVAVKKTTAKANKLVSDNFVKIDLRKKTYVRGLKKLTGAQIKRREWKKKTAFERPIKTSKTGKSICFKCGGEGHWAKFCKEQFKKKVNPFNKIDEEKKSLDFEHMNESGSNPFGETGDISSSVLSQSNFTMDDVMKIEPCWPRVPYNTTEQQEADTSPLCEPDDDAPSSTGYKKVTSTLKTFGYDSFREGQREATARIISGLSTLVILSTGSGKSLCYQLPAYLYYKERGWITIVVSPLIALMQDQVAGLPASLPGACLNGNMTKLQQEKTITKLKEGKLAVLLVSPETLVSGGFGYGLLPPKNTLPPIAFACIDEAHCLSEWSHNFRPSYLKVCKVLQDRYNIKCLLGLTATASLATAKSVVHHLGITSEGSIIRDPHPVPQNLHITASRDVNRDEALIHLLQLPPFDTCDSIIVYTTRRTETERLAGKLRTCLPEFTPTPKDEDEDEGETKKPQKKKIKTRARKKPKPFWWNVDCYHAGQTPAERKRIQNDFMSGDLRIVVATVAFGMGLDKADVRSVIHYNMPKSFENYVQEIGRAGRDGKPAFCHVFLSEERSVAFGMGLDKADVRSVIHYNMPKSFENYVQEIGRAGRDGKPAFCHVFLSEESGDLNEIRRHIYADGVDRRTIEKFVDLSFPPCTCADLHKKHSRGDVSKPVLPTLTDSEYPHQTTGAWEETMQSLSDDEMELLFSQHFELDEEDLTTCAEKDDLDNQPDAEKEMTNAGKDSEDAADVDSVMPESSANEADGAVSKQSRHETESIIDDQINTLVQNDDLKTLKNENHDEGGSMESEESEETSMQALEETENVVKPSSPLDEGDAQIPSSENVDFSVSSEQQANPPSNSEQYYCSGHRVCISVDDTIADLDMPEENIATLMSYLELHDNKWLEVLNPIRAFCSIKCYGGPEQFQMLAKGFHPVAVYLRNCFSEEPHKFKARREIDFNLAEVADIMCWDVLTIAREVRALQWNMAFALDKELNTSGKSGIIVECENLSFHFVTRDGIDDDARDEMCDFLHEATLKQEETRLVQLDALYTSLRKLSSEHYWQLNPEKRVDSHIRKCIYDYFLSDELGQLAILKGMCGEKVEQYVPERKWNAIAGDIRSLMIAHPQSKFTGRALARIFHGINSPCFPAINFGRDRRYWRAYLDVDFNELRIYSTKILRSLKGVNDKL